MEYQLLAVDDSASVIGAVTFGHWVSASDAIEAMREDFPTAIGIIEAKGFRVIWQDKHALASLS